MQSVSRLSSDDQLMAIADPIRQSILREVMASPATISQLGARRGKHPAWVRHHIKALERAGLVTLVETRTVRNYTEKYYGATAPAYVVERVLRPEGPGPSPLVMFASHDFALALLTADDGQTQGPIVGVSGSLDSLISLRQGASDIAGCHLLDAPTGEYNVPYVRHIFPDRDVLVVTVAHREQGLITAKGNPRSIRGIEDIAAPDVTLINRNRGSGTRVWLDNALHTLGIPHAEIAGYESEALTHTQAASVVACGEADVALGIRAAADAQELGFVPLFTERYDLVIPRELLEGESVSRLLEKLHGAAFRRDASRLCGYHTEHTGDETLVAI